MYKDLYLQVVGVKKQDLFFNLKHYALRCLGMHGRVLGAGEEILYWSQEEDFGVQTGRVRGKP